MKRRNPLFRLGPLALAVMLAAGAGGAQESSVPLYDNLGTHHYSITVSDPQAQRYFDQGLRLYYAFNHQEAIRAFTEAARLDPACAMCHWGIALALGPNINAPMDPAAVEPALAALEMARQGQASEVERALIEALVARYASPPPEDRSALDLAYAEAMGKVVQRYPDNHEAATLHAEALMDLSPWQYWEADGEPRQHTPQILARLERVIADNPRHPGACHFFIHAVEAVDPQRAVPCAERLAGLMPGAGHLVHMPGHIYVRVGRYEDAIRANEHAVHADETFIRDQSPALGVYVVGYYPHNYDFLAFAASMIGRSEQALGAARKIAELVPEPLLREPGMTFLQNHQTRHLQMLVRFSRWDELLAIPEPPANLPHARGVWHYARGRALAATGDLGGAAEQLTALRTIAQGPALAEARMEFNTSGAVLAVATQVLDGVIAARQGNHKEAVERLREGARLEDALTYGEPPEWTVPVRHDLGNVLLEAGDPAAAEQVFREDLKRFPDNGWSLHGLQRSLQAMQRDEEAGEVRQRLERIWSGADVRLTAHAH